MDHTFDFIQKYGAIKESDYPYVSGSWPGEETECQHSENTKTKVLSTYVREAKDPIAIREALRDKGPLSLAMGFGNQLFGYSSGAIDYNEGWCSSYLNHALTITGYAPGPETTSERGTVTYCRRRWKKDYPECR